MEGFDAPALITRRAIVARASSVRMQNSIDLTVADASALRPFLSVCLQI